MERVEVRVLSIVPGPHGQTLVLGNEEEGRYLPVVIGVPEALAIHYRLAGQEFGRPLSHDLLAALFEALGARLESVTITELREGTFHAALHAVQDGGAIDLDSRSSDAVALALRLGATIFVAEPIMRTESRRFDEPVEGPAFERFADWSEDDDEIEDDGEDPGGGLGLVERNAGPDEWDRFREIMRDAGLDEEPPAGRA